MSQARFAEEASHAIKTENCHLLLATEEGRCILNRFAKATGSDFNMMLEYEDDVPGHVAEWIHHNEGAMLIHFLPAIVFTFNLK